MNKIDQALALAVERHAGQVRKDGVTPYVVHPLRMAFTLLLEFGVDDPELLVACLLHDTIEDTATDYGDVAEISERSARLVAALTDDKRLPTGERQEAYLAGLRAAPAEARLLKMVDVLDNLDDMKNLPAERHRRFLEKKRAVVEMLVETASPEHREFAGRVEALYRDRLAELD